MKKYLILFLLSPLALLIAQTTSSLSFHSELLEEDRNIRIHLPKSYDKDDEVQYPLTLVLDGEYLFYSIMGVAEVLTTRKLLPESIVVGIDQNYLAEDSYTARWLDCSYDYKSGKLDAKGLKFKAFIEKELIPFLEEEYKVGEFKTIAGHSFTANYINYFLEASMFNGFIAISPYIPQSLEAAIAVSLSQAKSNIYYYLCTGENDLSGHILQVRKQDSLIFSQIHNPKLHYQFKNYPNESHMSLAVRGISDALSQIYCDYSPIYTLDMDSVLMKESDLRSYLIDRYQNMQNTYGISIPYREDDILSISWIAEEKENWEELNEIGQMEIEFYPESVYGYYMLALSEEKQNNLALALEYYTKGYAKLGEEVGNKADFYADIERIEKLLNEK